MLPLLLSVVVPDLGQDRIPHSEEDQEETRGTETRGEDRLLDPITDFVPNLCPRAPAQCEGASGPEALGTVTFAWTT